MSVIQSPPDFKGDPVRFAKTLLDWFDNAGDGVLRDSDQTLLDHARACADLAQLDKAPETEIVSSYFHMVGALLTRNDPAEPITLTPAQQAQLGANWMEKIFPRNVTDPVRFYPLARRWLLALDKPYRALLTDREYRELADQGGPLVSSERERFEHLPNWQAAVSLARRHDEAKVQKPWGQARQAACARDMASDASAPPQKTSAVLHALQNCLTVPLSVLLDEKMPASESTNSQLEGNSHSVSAII